MKVFTILLLIFCVNYVVLDSVTTETAISKGAYETNALAFHLLNTPYFFMAKVLAALVVVVIALWVRRKDEDLANKAVMAAAAFSFGVVYNNLLIILGGIT